MPRPRKNPNDPKWSNETTAPEAAQDVPEAQTDIVTAVAEEVPQPKPEPKQPKTKTAPLTMVQAFIAFQQQVPTIKKDAKGNYGEYTSLDELINKALPVLNRLGFWFSQNVYTDDLGNNHIQTTLTYITGEVMQSGGLRLSVDGVGMQKLGSAITYARRYQAASFLGLVTDKDDDGQAAQDASTEAATHEQAKADKNKQKYIQYIEAISSKLEIDKDPDIYEMAVPALVTLAKELKGKLDAQTATA